MTETRWVGRVGLELAPFDPMNEQVLWSRAFLEEEPLDEQSPEGLARALSMALARIVEQSSGPILAAAALARGGDSGKPDCSAAGAR